MARHEDAPHLPAGLTISPTGNKVAYYVRTKVDRSERPSYASSIWVADVGKENSARRVTDGTFDNHSPQWSGDGTYIVFMSDRHEPGKKYNLYRLWFGVDAQPGPLIVPWEFTKFTVRPSGDQAVIIDQLEPYWNQRFADCRWLKFSRFHTCEIEGSGYVAAMAACAVDYRVAILTHTSSDPETALHGSRICMGGGDSRPAPISDTPFPFPVVGLAWAGSTLYIHSGDSGEGGNSSKPAIYALGQHDVGGNYHPYIKVYGDGDGDGHVLGLSRAGDDLLIHARDGAGDKLHLLHAGRTLWKQKSSIFEAVATKADQTLPETSTEDRRNGGGGAVFVTGMISAEGDQPAEVFSIVESSASAPGERVQLSDHGSMATTAPDAIPGLPMYMELPPAVHESITRASLRSGELSTGSDDNRPLSLPYRPKEDAPTGPDQNPATTATAGRRPPFPIRRWTNYYCPYPTASERAADERRKRLHLRKT